jgi:hypothetical protein
MPLVVTCRGRSWAAGTLVAITTALAIAGTGHAQIYAPVSISVDQARCTGGPVDRCRVPSGESVRFKGGETEIGTDTVAAGTPVRVATAAPGGPVAVAQTTTDEYGEWSMSFVPRVSGMTFAAQLLVGADWLTIPGAQAEVTVFAELVGAQIGFGPRLPVLALGRVSWVERDGVGRAELRRCRFAAKRRCTSLKDFRTVVASQRLRRSGGGSFRISTRSPLAYGRPLAVVYKPRASRKVKPDLAVFKAVPTSYRPR